MLLIRGILAALRQKFHLTTCPNSPGHLYLLHRAARHVRRPPTGRGHRRHRSRGTARAVVPPPFAACCCKRNALARAGGPRGRADPAGAKHPARALLTSCSPPCAASGAGAPGQPLRTLLARICLRSAAARLAAVRAWAASWRDRSASAATRRMRPSMVSSIPRTAGAGIRPHPMAGASQQEFSPCTLAVAASSEPSDFSCDLGNLWRTTDHVSN